MSATQVTEAGDELQFTAFTTLSRLIKAETNPDRLEKLLALAIRARTTTRQPAVPPSPPPSPGSAGDRALGSEADESRKSGRTRSVNKNAGFGRADEGALQTTSPLSTPASIPSRASPRNVCEVEDLDDEDESDSSNDLLPLSPLPTFTLMSDAEYLALEKQIGPVEAHRRRLIRAHLVANQHRRDADSS